MRYMNADQHFKVVSVAGWCMWHDLKDKRALRPRGAARDRGALRRHRRGLRQRLAVSTTSPNNGTAPEFMHKVWRSVPRADRPQRGRAVEARRLEDLLRRCCRSTTRSAGAKAACTTPRCCSALLGWRALRRAGRDRHAVLRQFGHRADQRDLPGDAAAGRTAEASDDAAPGDPRYSGNLDAPAQRSGRQRHHAALPRPRRHDAGAARRSRNSRCFRRRHPRAARTRRRVTR